MRSVIHTVFKPASAAATSLALVACLSTQDVSLGELRADHDQDEPTTDAGLAQQADAGATGAQEPRAEPRPEEEDEDEEEHGASRDAGASTPEPSPVDASSAEKDGALDAGDSGAADASPDARSPDARSADAAPDAADGGDAGDARTSWLCEREPWHCN